MDHTVTRNTMPPEGLEILRKWRSAQGQAWHVGRPLQDLKKIRATNRVTVVNDRKDEARWTLAESQVVRPLQFIDAFVVDHELQDVDSDDSEEEGMLSDDWEGDELPVDDSEEERTLSDDSE